MHEHRLTTSTTIGSTRRAALIIDDSTVSRLHAELSIREDGVWLRDLGSRNGSYVAGTRVEVARVADVGRFVVGRTEVALAIANDCTAAPPMLGGSLAMKSVAMQLARVARSEACVLVTGETGTGKELAARAIHEASRRAGGPFVVVDCGALPETLLDSELFGHARSAFTGATTMRVGAFEAAHGGTAFLDEIGELPIELQPRLLRFIEARTVRRLGETEERPVDVRIVAATHRDLRAMTEAGTFREDLYFRLAVLPVELPPLRDRIEDLPVLLEKFLGARARQLPDDAIERLAQLPWNGNVRELRSFAERCAALGIDDALALSFAREERRKRTSAATSVSVTSGPPPEEWLKLPYKEFRERWSAIGEREYFRRLMEEVDWSVSSASARAGLERTYLHRLLKRLGV